MEKRSSESLSLLEGSLMEEDEGLKASTSFQIANTDDELKFTKAEIGEAREENKKLKQLLERVLKDYQLLQILFYQVLEKEQSKKSIETEQSDDQMVSLCLGRTSNEVEKDKIKNRNQKEDGKLQLGLNLKFEPGLNEIRSKNQSSVTTFEEEKKEDDAVEIWRPASKSFRATTGEENEVSQLKKTRVSVKVRCESQTMNDGCQWRKYGQKISKGNPCPRAYYRCTLSPSCPVRKQVQRCTEDMTILITTYEGSHNHPLSLSATAMASTTSAAASNSSLPSTFSNSHPTITLDLTSPSKSLPAFSASSSSYLHKPWNSDTIYFSNGGSPSKEHFYPPFMSTKQSSSNPDFQTVLAAVVKENHGGEEGFKLEFNGLIMKNETSIAGLKQKNFCFEFREK